MFQNIFISGNYAQITDIVPSLSDSQVVSDSGIVQDALASLLPMGETFYVNAQSSDISYLFEYSPDSASENAVFHFSGNSKGPCLTYTKSDNSLLDSTGTDAIKPQLTKTVGVKISSNQESHVTQVFPRFVSALWRPAPPLRRSATSAPQTTASPATSGWTSRIILQPLEE